ncbi:cadherin-23-like [Mizuhopecten yessoensis]|uniref:Cadherin EGF LAG seven-pass G-type receptor 2 n=1 Tax=Mizuhopecten yessoensis TaxID=6573 RepID=A0A210PPY6_MIZYE|nr:cadherin-23-like [Mizuhopecten yessoensis]OWF38514.1 Cadherin EGF LAG seven-pass G-type receptor 2 [Mizuhopecten yessoensis]
MTGLWICVTIILIHQVFPCQAVAPVLSGLPTSISVGELETANRLIYTITVTDPDNDAYVCDVSSTVPANGPFVGIKDTDTNKYGIYTDTPTFSYATTTVHTVNIECTDTGGLIGTGVLSVDVIEGDALTFNNLPASTTHDASTTLNGAGIYTVTTTDAKGHTTKTYTMTSTPSTTSFVIDAGTGAVTADRDLKYEIYTSVKLYITVSDGSIAAVEVLTVVLTNVNNVPTFTNLPASIDVVESAAAGTVLITLTPNDADAGASLTYTMSVDPVASANLFAYNTNTQQVTLATGQNFNYESVIYFNVTFTVFDQLATGGPFVLDVHIKDDDEPCYFDKSYYSLSTSEGASGSISLNPNFIISDYDGISSYSLSFTTANNSERFTIDASTGVIGFAVNYDIDNSAMPSTVILTVECKDATSQTGTTNVQISIADVNDNAPTFGSASYILTVDQYSSAGTLIGSLAPTDADSGSNADYTCSATTTSATGSTYYNIGSDCGVYLIATPYGNIDYGTMVRFSVTATDKGSTPLSGTTFVDIIFKEATTTTTTTTAATTTASNFFDDPGSLAAFVVAVVLGAIILALLLYMCLRWWVTGACCGPDPCDFCYWCRGDGRDQCCQRKQRRHRKRVVTPETPERPKRKSKGEFEYWKEDSDYGSLSRADVKQNRSSRMTGHRDYPDFPRSSSKAIPPTDIGIGYSRPATRIIPTGYY